MKQCIEITTKIVNGEEKEKRQPCSDWKNCLGKEWFQPAEIDMNYCYYQMFFLIWHWGELAEDKWPQAPEGITDFEYSPRMIKHHAYFEIPALFRAELEVRLKETKTDGKLLARHIWGLSEGDLFPQYPFKELDYEARTALFYISGGRKKRSYNMWKADRNYDKNIRKGVQQLT